MTRLSYKHAKPVFKVCGLHGHKQDSLLLVIYSHRYTPVGSECQQVTGTTDTNDGTSKQVKTDPKPSCFWRSTWWRTATKMDRKERIQTIDAQKENNQILLIQERSHQLLRHPTEICPVPARGHTGSECAEVFLPSPSLLP